MGEYLTKEEIRRWRSSLERITLEEYAARLGKTIQESKHDDSLVDSVTLRTLNSMTDDAGTSKAEKIQISAAKSLSREKETKEQIKPKEIKIQSEKNETKAAEKETNRTVKAEKTAVLEAASKPQKQQKKTKAEKKPEVLCSFNKALTPREQLVFDHFAANCNTIVYAKDLAEVLELPRDYVYKYIKNLRSKLNEDILQNADNGGYILKAQA